MHIWTIWVKIVYIPETLKKTLVGILVRSVGILAHVPNKESPLLLLSFKLKRLVGFYHQVSRCNYPPVGALRNLLQTDHF